jgi:hypothetical protein
MMRAVWRACRRGAEHSQGTIFVVEAPTRFGKRALEVARDEELAAILRLVYSEIAWYEARGTRSRDIAEALRGVTRWLESAAHRDGSTRARMTIFDPRGPSQRVSLSAGWRNRIPRA